MTVSEAVATVKGNIVFPWFWPIRSSYRSWINIKQIMDFEITLQFLSLDISISLHFKNIVSLVVIKKKHKMLPIPSANKRPTPKTPGDFSVSFSSLYSF
jgi:hypothetical protein